MDCDAVDRVFARSDDDMRALAGELVRRLSADTTVRVEPKESSIHLCRKSAFAGLHPRKSAVLLNIRSARPIESDRVRKVEQVSANRFHSELLVQRSEQLDEELFSWLREAAELAG
jgi:uncharacterized protein DUF5655